MKNNFQQRFDEMSEFYELYKPNYVECFIKRNEKLLDLLETAKPLLAETFPTADFELEVHCDVEEGNHALLVNIHVDNETYHNGFREKKYKLFLELLPLQQKYDLVLNFVLVDGFRYVKSS